MKAYILAAGESTRMSILSSNTPKPLLEIGGKPFIIHTINTLLKNGINDIIILVGWKYQKIITSIGNGKDIGANIRFIYQEKRLGTAHALRMAADYLDDEFVLINGDVLLTEDIMDKVMKHSGRNLIMASKVKYPERYGVIEEKDGKFVRIHEKPVNPPSNLVNAGIYLFDKKIFDYVNRTEKSPRGEYELTDTLMLMKEDGNVIYVDIIDKWIEIGYPWNLLDANEYIINRMTEKNKCEIKGKIEENVFIHGNVHLEEGAVIKSGTYIEGNVFIGKNAVIGPNSYIRGTTYLAENVKVGSASEVKNSIIMKNTNIPHHNYVGDSVIGENCNLGSGTKVANLRLDNNNVRCIIKGKFVDTGRRKMGVIMGSDVKTGINACIDPGTVIGNRCFIGPSAKASRYIESGSKVL